MADVKQSVWHGGQAFLERIDEIQQSLDVITVKREVETNKAALLKLWLQNYSLLNAFFKEIYPKMNKEERESHKVAQKVVKNYVDKAKHDLLTGNKIDLSFIEMMDRWERKLKVICEVRGLTLPDKADMREAMEL